MRQCKSVSIAYRQDHNKTQNTIRNDAVRKRNSGKLLSDDALKAQDLVLTEFGSSVSLAWQWDSLAAIVCTCHGRWFHHMSHWPVISSWSASREAVISAARLRKRHVASRNSARSWTTLSLVTWFGTPTQHRAAALPTPPSLHIDCPLPHWLMIATVSTPVTVPASKKMRDLQWMRSSW